MAPPVHRVDPPSGSPPPASARLAGRTVALGPLAEAIADRYFAEFPEDLERYGAAARPWELHDTAYCLQWALLDVEGLADLQREIAWLRDILHARGFPLEHLARNLELAADVVAEELGADGAQAAARLREAAQTARRPGAAA
jgi:hypothetical protein